MNSKEGKKKRDRPNWASLLPMLIYEAGAFATFVYLTFFDGYGYNAWNWIPAVGINSLMAAMWPLYWLAIRWLVLGLNSFF